MDERAKTIYAGMLRQRLRKRMPEHAETIEMLSDDRIVELDREHQTRKVEVFAAKMVLARKRAEAPKVTASILTFTC